MRPGPLLVVALALLAPACSLLASFDGLSSGPAATADASDDAAETDGAPEARTDAADASAVDAALGTFCQDRDAGFCESFDEPTAPWGFETVMQRNGSVAAARAAGEVLSLPGAAVARLSQTAAKDAQSIALLRHASSGENARELVAEGAFRLTDRPRLAAETRFAEILVLQVDLVGDNNFQIGLGVVAHPQRAELLLFRYDSLADQTVDVDRGATLTDDAWTRLRLTVRLGQTQTATVDQIDGAATTTLLSGSVMGTGFGQEVEDLVVLTGAYADGPHTGWSALVDDVAFERRP